MSNRTLSNRYTLEAEIGRGGMGVVYRAEDAQVKRTVAIKTLPSIMTHNPELMRRFNSEVQHASKLSHSNIARVYDVGEDAGTHYYVMQYIDGKSLRELLKEKGRFTLEEALPILEQVASALDYAYSQGIIHRDIKPENILLDQAGNAFVVDFGIAKAAEGTRTTRGMLGTPEYMSPEQIRGEAVAGRSDQYSLAVVAYEMLTGRTPFKTEGDDPWAQINQHLSSDPLVPRTIAPSLTDVASNALLKGLEKDSSDRFSSCNEFVCAIQGSHKFSSRHVRRLPVFAWAICVVVLIAICSFFAFRYYASSRYVPKEHKKIVTRNMIEMLVVQEKQGNVYEVYLLSLDRTPKKHLFFAKEAIKYFSKNLNLFATGDQLSVYGTEGITVYNNTGSVYRALTSEEYSKQFTNAGYLAETIDMSADGKYLLFYAISAGESPKRACFIYLWDLKANQITRVFDIELQIDSFSLGTFAYGPLPVFAETGPQIAYIGKNHLLTIYDINKKLSKPISSLSHVIEKEDDYCQYEIRFISMNVPITIDIETSDKKKTPKRLSVTIPDGIVSSLPIEHDSSEDSAKVTNLPNNAQLIGTAKVAAIVEDKQSISKEESIIGKQKTEVIKRTYVNDFDGDGTEEHLYDSGQRIWLVKGNSSIWETSYIGSTIMVADITHEGRTDIAVYDAASEYKSYHLNVFTWKGSSMTNILSKTFFWSGKALFAPSNKNSEIIIHDSPAIIYKWDGKRFAETIIAEPKSVSWYTSQGYTIFEGDPDTIPR